jgi:phosphatidylinositol-3,4,5-trisphosphate 3-phosphatase/dual-specificity protein phosphatase PTEN
MEEENNELRAELETYKKRVVVLERKMDQVLSLVASPAFNKMIKKCESEEGNSGQGQTSAVTNKIRGFVSLKKLRYQKDGFDLDLSYITPRIIAMGIPSEGIEAVYRNSMTEMVRFFEHYHHGHYKIYNLCAEPSRQYIWPIKDGEKVVAVYPFWDHNACPLPLLKLLCNDMQAWLAKDPKHVAAVHCKAGKGRTGTAICAYLVHGGKCATADESLNYYGAARTSNGKGVTIPSQRRFVGYYADLIAANGYVPTFKYVLTRLRMSPVPSFHWGAQGGCAPYFLIYNCCNGVEEQVSFDSLTRAAPTRVSKADGEVQFDFGSQRVEMVGTIKFQLMHYPGNKKPPVKMCHFWLSTAFSFPAVDASGVGKVVLTKQEIDKANNDKSHFEDNFVVELFFRQDPEAPMEPVMDEGHTLGEEGVRCQQEKIGTYLVSVKGRGGVNEQAEEYDTDEEEMLSQNDLTLTSTVGTPALTASSKRPNGGRASVLFVAPPLGGQGVGGTLAESGRKQSFLQKARRQSKIIKSMFGAGGGGNDGAGLDTLPDMKEEEDEGEDEDHRERGSTNMSSMGQHMMGDVLSRHREGWMNKKGGSRRNWKRRWFVLQVVDDGEGAECPILCYYETPSDTNPLGQIDLRNTETANSRDPAMLSKHPHSFEIAHRGKCLVSTHS